MKNGYVALHRKIQDHPFYKEKREFSKYEAWIDILMEVQHSNEAKDVILGMKVLKCFYGESLKSLKTWAKRWNWSASKVKRFFDLLKKMEQISVKSETITTRLKVLNYHLYDPKRNGSETQMKRKRNGSETEAVTDNNEKNVNNENVTLENEFNKFWNIYNKKEDRKKCLTKWKRLKQVDKDKIFETLPAYIKSTPDRQFRKYPATYLNNESWNNEIIDPLEEELRKNPHLEPLKRLDKPENLLRIDND